MERWGKTVVMGTLALAPACTPRLAPAPAYTVYVTNEQSGDLSIIDGASGRLQRTVALGRRPRGIRRSPDGQTLFIALSGSPIAGPGVDESKLPPADKGQDGIAVFDTAARRVTRVISGISDPEQLAVSRDGRLFVASEDTGRAVVLNAASGRALGAVDIGSEPEGVALSPDGDTIWVTSEGDARVGVLDTHTLKLLGSVPVGQRPRNTVFSADGRLAYVSGEADRSITVVDVARRAPVSRIDLPGDASLRPMGLALAPAGDRLYVTTGRGGQVLAVNLRSRRVVAAVTVGKRPWGLALSPDGSRLYTANGPSDDVSVIDRAAMKVVGRIKAGTSPWGIAIVGG